MLYSYSHAGTLLQPGLAGLRDEISLLRIQPKKQQNGKQNQSNSKGTIKLKSDYGEGLVTKVLYYWLIYLLHLYVRT